GRAQTVESEHRLTQRLEEIARSMEASGAAMQSTLGDRIATPVDELRREIESLRRTISDSVVANAEAIVFVGQELRRTTEESNALAAALVEAVDRQMAEVRDELASGLSDVRASLGEVTEAIEGDVLRRAVGSS